LDYLQSQYLSVTQDPGVYQLLSDNGQVLYVGKASNLRKRLSSYFQKSRDLDEKTKALVSKVKKIRIIGVSSEVEALLLEAALIKKYLPKYNIRLTDGKSYQMIRVSIADEFPKVLLTRRETDSKSVYYGPFPSSNSIRIVLKTIRKIFPYISVKNHQKRICLYYHLSLCPCPSTQDTIGKKKDYRKNIRRIVRFLNGDIDEVLKDLEREREIESKSENFEKASEAQKKIEAIKLITSPFYKPFQFEENPMLKSRVRLEEIRELEEFLSKNGVTVSSLGRIECYDISNTSGTNATGSMVVFTKGERDSDSYRHFRIKNPPKVIPNDFAMIAEIIARRLSHFEDWGVPDLIIVDGGKGQVSSALKVFKEAKSNIPLIGLAKKEELIVTSDLRVLRLPRGSKALNLVRRIRDEAHRFAITYHKKLRSRATFG